MAPSLHRHYPTSSVLRATPSSQRAESDRHRSLVGVSRPHPMGLPVLRAQFPFHACHCQYPGTAVGCIFHSLPLRWQPSPHRLVGRPVHHPFRGVLSIHSRCGLRVRQGTYVPLYTRGSSQFVTFLTAPVASGRSESDRVGFAPTGKAPPLHGARRTWAAQILWLATGPAEHKIETKRAGFEKKSSSLQDPTAQAKQPLPVTFCLPKLKRSGLSTQT